MACLELAPWATRLAAAILDAGGGCRSLAISVDEIPADDPIPACGDYPAAETAIAGLFDTQGRIRVSSYGAGPGGVIPIDCAAGDQRLDEMLMECLLKAQNGGFMMAIFEDPLPDECTPIACDDEEPLETMLRGCFARLDSNGVTPVVRTIQSAGGTPIECGFDEPPESLLRSCMHRISATEYALRIAYV